MSMKTQTKTGLPRLKIVTAAMGMAIVSGTVAYAQVPYITEMPVTILPNQPYALCAGAIAWVFDNVAYANCMILNGNSISLTQSYPYVPATNQPAGDIQTVANQGAMSGTFKVSTYSPPDSVLGGPGKHPTLAVYTCPVRSTGSYAQCDGGICFTNTTGTTFPGLGPIASHQIVCSCPVRTPSVAYEIMAPTTSQGACLPNWESTLCGVGEKPIQRVSNGTTLYIGAPLGGFQYFAARLLGAPVKLNECKGGQ